MSQRYRKRGRGHRNSAFVMLPLEVLNSQAYKSMPASACKALPYFRAKVKENPADRAYLSTEFSLSYGEASRYGFASSTFHNVITDLVAFGFIDPADKGGLRGDGLTCNRFRNSERWKRYGTQEFQPMSWAEFQPRQRSRSRATPKSETNNIGIRKAKPLEADSTSKSDVVGAEDR